MSSPAHSLLVEDAHDSSRMYVDRLDRYAREWLANKNSVHTHYVSMLAYLTVRNREHTDPDEIIIRLLDDVPLAYTDESGWLYASAHAQYVAEKWRIATIFDQVVGDRESFARIYGACPPHIVDNYHAYNPAHDPSRRFLWIHNYDGETTSVRTGFAKHLLFLHQTRTPGSVSLISRARLEVGRQLIRRIYRYYGDYSQPVEDKR